MRKSRKPVKSPLLKKKRTSSESTFIRSLVDDPDNLPVMVARPPGQSDVIKTRKFHGHRLPSATNRTRDVSFYDPWYPCTSIMQIRMKVTKRCSWRICIYIYSRGEASTIVSKRIEIISMAGHRVYARGIRVYVSCISGEPIIDG